MTSRYENPGPNGYIPKPLVDMGPSPVLDAMSGDSYNKGAWQHGGNWYFKNKNGRVQYLGKNKPKVKTVLKAPAGFNFRDAFGVPNTATGLKPKTPAVNPNKPTTGGGTATTTPAAGGATAPARGAYWGPWMQGFSAAGTPWNMNVDGGWTNETTGTTWKPGMPIPTTIGGSSTDPSMEIYKQLMSALTSMFQPTVPKV